MKEYHPYYRPQTRTTNEDITYLLALKTFTRMSNSQWAELRKSNNVPIYRTSIAQKRKSLLSPTFAKSLQLESGAYLDYWPYFDNIITAYKQHNAFLEPTSLLPIWQWKLSWDNRYISGKNEAWSLSPFTVHHPQRPTHSHLLMLASIEERNIPMARCISESQLGTFIGELDGSEQYWKDEDIFQRVFVSADWNAIVRALDAPLPNTVNLLAPVCWQCGINKVLLRTEWLQDPFRWHDTILPISTFLNAIFDQLPLTSYRYCWMHNVANALSNVLTQLADYLLSFPSQLQSYLSIIHEFEKNWYPTKPLLPKKMKAFFSSTLSSQLTNIFKSISSHHHLLWPDSPSFILTTFEVVEMLFDSLATFYHFAYTISPTSEDFTHLLTARNCLLSCYALFKWRIPPTTHYLTNHGILHAETDGTAYNTLQEGAEHLNHCDKETYRHSFTSPSSSSYNRESSWQYLLNQYQLHLHLFRLGYTHPPYQLAPSDNYVTYTTHVVKSPRHAPLNN
jgi:hypothetical protein